MVLSVIAFPLFRIFFLWAEEGHDDSTIGNLLYGKSL